MIHTRFGSTVTIKANLGKHFIVGYRAPITLVAIDVTYANKPGAIYHDYAAAEHLKADDGWQEIFRAINEAPKRQVDKYDLNRILARL